VSLSGNPGSGGGPTTFTFVANDANTGQVVDSIFLIFNWGLMGGGACYLLVLPPVSAIYLADDSGVNWGNPVAPGQNATLANSQCRLNAQSTTVQVQGNKVTVRPNLTFLPSFLGPQNVWALAYDHVNGTNSGWQWAGNYTAFPPPYSTPPRILTSGISGTAMTGAFTFKAADDNGYGYIPMEEMAFMPEGVTGGGPEGCYFQYYRADNLVYLLDPFDLSWVPPGLSPGTPGTVPGSAICRPHLACRLHTGSNSSTSRFCLAILSVGPHTSKANPTGVRAFSSVPVSRRCFIRAARMSSATPTKIHSWSLEMPYTPGDAGAFF
jgi:hypothetical protein